MKLVSIETIPGQEFEALDMVRGTVVYSPKTSATRFHGGYEDPGGR